MVRQDENGNLAPDRKRSTEKIDGMVAMIMAIGRALIHEDTRSVYESRGLVTI
jgi:phage terminase large subunit-like protein